MLDNIEMEEYEKTLKKVLEIYRKSKAPSRRIGYMRVKRIIGVVVGLKDKNKTKV